MLEYAKKHDLHALLVLHGESVEIEIYGEGYGPQKPHPLYSGAKSFWGTAALHAQHDGLLSLDEPIGTTLPELHDARATITPRLLLTMTAGYGFGGLGNAAPTYARTLEIPLKSTPGTVFTYGGIPLQLFGAFFARKLESIGSSPHRYLIERILDPAGVAIGSWRTLADGHRPLPTGAQLTARAWAAYGRWMLAHRDAYRDAFNGSALNPRYGLGWWLAAPGIPGNTFYASGSGGQALYVVPSRDLVVVHFGKSASYKHEAMLKRVLF